MAQRPVGRRRGEVMAPPDGGTTVHAAQNDKGAPLTAVTQTTADRFTGRHTSGQIGLRMTKTPHFCGVLMS